MTTPKQNDMVNSPAHYASGDIECIDAISASMTDDEFRGYLKGNVMKYMWRYENKGKPEEDLAKAEWYLHRLQGAPTPKQNDIGEDDSECDIEDAIRYYGEKNLAPHDLKEMFIEQYKLRYGDPYEFKCQDSMSMTRQIDSAIAYLLEHEKALADGTNGTQALDIRIRIYPAQPTTVEFNREDILCGKKEK